MRLKLALLTVAALSIPSPALSQLLPPTPVTPLPVPNPVNPNNPVIVIPEPVVPLPTPTPVVVDLPGVNVPVVPVSVDIPPIVIDPDVQDIVAPIIPNTVTIPTVPVQLPTVGDVLDLPDDIVDAVGNTINSVVAGPVTTLADGNQIIPLINPATQAVVGSIDPATGAIARPDGQVIGNVTNQGGSGSGSGTGGAGSGSGTARSANTNNVNVRNRNTFINIPTPALATDGKTTTELIDEVDERGNVRQRTITTGYTRSVPTLSVSGGYVADEWMGLVQVAIPLK